MNHDELIKLDRTHVWHPCTQEKDHEQLLPIPITHGDGVYLYDDQGKSYIDAVSSWWVNLFGHNHTGLNAALNEQAGKVAHHIFAGFTHEPGIRLASRLAELTPDKLNKVFFSDNGSAAVEVALKMSFQYWQQVGVRQKTRFVSIRDAYHGETLGALSVSGCDLYREIYQPILLEGFQVAGPDCFRCPYQQHRDSCNAECFSSMEQLVARDHEQIAGIIIEPLIQCAAGMRIYPPVYLQKLRQLCDQYAVHYIADEIAVGFGRTGKLFANQHAGTAPDLLCLSKGITGGYMPLAVTLTTDEIYRAFYDDYATMKAFLHSHSYTGNPLACALGNKVLDLFAEEKILEKTLPQQRLLSDWKHHFEELPHVGEMRQQGMVAAVEMVVDKQHKTPYPWQQRRGYQVFQEALNKGVLLRPLGNVVYFMPPLTIQPDELLRVLQVARDAIIKITAD